MIRELDSIDRNEEELAKWFKLNPLFRAYTNLFDMAFNRGFRVEKEQYVYHKIEHPEYETFEERFIQDYICRSSNVSGHLRTYLGVLEGNVGRGKSAFVDRIRYELIRGFKKYKTLPIRLDLFNKIISLESHEAEMQEIFVSSMETLLIDELSIDGNKIYHDKVEFLRDIFTSLGAKNASDMEVLQGQGTLTVNDYLSYLFKNEYWDGVVIFIDNIDESTEDVIRSAYSFIEKIETWHEETTNRTMLEIFVPVREYINTKFFDTEHWAKIELPLLEYEHFLADALQSLQELIRKDTRNVQIPVDYTPGMSRNAESVQGRTMAYGKDSVVLLIGDLIKKIYNDHEKDFIHQMRDICAGNLKILLTNIYNLFHSYKLPITDIYQKYFRMEHEGPYSDARTHQLLDRGLIIECLMCIHYPFFDVRNSHILNVYSLNLNEYRDRCANTLLTMRILLYLRNCERDRYPTILQKFKNYGYSVKHTKLAIGRCLEKGVIESDHGFNISHFSDDTYISMNSATKFYVSHAAVSINYLQHACEDCYIEDEYCIPIERKYVPRHHEYGDRELRLQSAYRLIDYIKKLESEEERRIRTKKLDYKAFLLEVGYRTNGRGEKISDRFRRMNP